MSRSHKKHPFCGWTMAETEKWWKRALHGSERAIVRSWLAGNDFDTPIPESGWRRSWGPKDGKQRFNEDEMPELARK